jgi:triosephosphate isomerase
MSMTSTIFLNFKRFDISPDHGGVNRLAPSAQWGPALGSTLSDLLHAHSEDMRFVAFLPEAHLIGAIHAANADVISFGSQSVHWADTEAGGNFGAFTTQRTANAMKDLGCVWTMIGHSEERRDLARLLSLGGLAGKELFVALHRILNEKILAAQKAGLKVLYCIGENADEVGVRTSLLQNQIGAGLAGVDRSTVTLAYEPIWAIGPGKIPPTAEEIAAIAREIKSFTRLKLVYGGGLKEENAQAIGSIDSLDGGLVALTRFSGEIGFYPDEFVTIVENYSRGRSMS